MSFPVLTEDEKRIRREIGGEAGATKMNQLMGHAFAMPKTRILRCIKCGNDGDCEIEYSVDHVKECECEGNCFCYKKPIAIKWYTCPTCKEQFTVLY